MRNRMKTGQGCYFVPATFRGPIPWDFQIGSIQPRAGARTILTAYSEERREVEEAELVKLNPASLAFLDGVESPGVRYWIIRLSRVAQETEKVYEKALPWHTPEGIRHNRVVLNEIDQMTSGEASSLFIRNSVKWNRWKAIAEEDLQAKEK